MNCIQQLSQGRQILNGLQTKRPVIRCRQGLNLQKSRFATNKIFAQKAEVNNVEGWSPFEVQKIQKANPPSYRNPPQKYAIIEVGGGQLIVEEGRFYNVNKLKDVAEGSTINFGRVIAAKLDHHKYEFGKPYLSNVKVEADIIEHYRADKVMVFKFKAKKHFQRKKGHRQHQTRFIITKIYQQE